jgi:hypothetical protein
LGVFFLPEGVPLVAASIACLVCISTLHYQGVVVLWLVGLGVNHALLDVSVRGRRGEANGTGANREMQHEYNVHCSLDLVL